MNNSYPKNLHGKNSTDSTNKHHEADTGAASNTLKLRWHRWERCDGLAGTSGHGDIHAGSVLSRAGGDVRNTSRWVRRRNVSRNGNLAESHVHAADNLMLHGLLGIAGANRIRGVLSSRRRGGLSSGGHRRHRVSWVLRGRRRCRSHRVFSDLGDFGNGRVRSLGDFRDGRIRSLGDFRNGRIRNLGSLGHGWVCRLARRNWRGRVLRRVHDRRSRGWVLRHSSNGGNGLGDCHSQGAGSVYARGPSLRNIGGAGGLRALGADSRNVRRGDRGKTGGANIDVGSFEKLVCFCEVKCNFKLTGNDTGGGASGNSWVLGLLRLLGDGRRAVVTSAGRSWVLSVALGALSGVLGTLAGRVCLNWVHC